MATVHQSELSSFARCAQAYSLERAGHQTVQTSALTYGTVLHHCLLNVFEREFRTGTQWSHALRMALDTFTHLWHPLHIEEITPPVERWLPNQSYVGMLRRGQEDISWYAGHVLDEDDEVLATEYGFAVPIEGTWDYERREPHVLAGSIDKLSIRRQGRDRYVLVDDVKTGKDHTYLRQNLQFTAYAYASTRPQFWHGWKGEDGFGARAGELVTFTAPLARRARWISLKSRKALDAGWRGPDDYSRLAVAVMQFFASVNADIFPLNISGDTCQYCNVAPHCAGVGVPGTEHGAPTPVTSRRP